MSHKYFLACFFIAVVFHHVTFAQNKANQLKPAEKADLLVQVLQKKHCEPRKIDNLFSEQLFDLFLKNLDEQKSIFTATDEVSLSKYKSLLDDQIKVKDLVILSKVAQIYRNRLLKIDSIIQQFTQKPIDFYAKTNYQPERTVFPKDEKEWHEYWQNELRYQMLKNVFNSLSTEKNVNFNDKTILAQKEVIARKRVRESNLRQIKSLLGQSNEDLENTVATTFLEAIANLYDKHTEYFGFDDALDFLKSGSTKNEIFGFRIGENKNGEIEILTLVPGSPAWKSGLLNKGDVIVSLQWEGKEVIDVTGVDEDEVKEFLASEHETPLHITVRKASQETVTVKLVRAAIVQDERGARGFILQNKEKFGYINLPAFYSDFEDAEGSGCANDVAKEIVKFNQEGIKGLILDLRFNGGGSLKEALDLAGIFIDQGVFGAYKGNSPKSYIAKDPNRGSIYDGPMIVLVNQASASASEILAGILQDYKRAVIVGAKTYGKGVAQTFFPLDSLSRMPRDFVKYTISRVFRPSGRALQTRGVMPDVVLPSMFDGMQVGEIYDGYFLSADTLTRVLNYSPLADLPIQKLAQKSQERQRNNSVFQHIEAAAKKIKDLELQKNKQISLEWNAFQQEFKKEKDEIASMTKATELSKANFTVSLTALEQQRTQLDSYWKELNEQIFETLKKDAYIEEAIQILLDLK
ncbi:carboxy terminal-processing peptidase [Emticicia sediminis]